MIETLANGLSLLGLLLGHAHDLRHRSRQRLAVGHLNQLVRRADARRDEFLLSLSHVERGQRQAQELALDAIQLVVFGSEHDLGQLARNS